MKNINQQINKALNVQMFEYKFKYVGDLSNTIYTNWLTESQFKKCYPGTVVISKTN